MSVIGALQPTEARSRAQTLTAVVTDKYSWLPSHGLLALTLSEVRRVGKPGAGIRAWERSRCLTNDSGPVQKGSRMSFKVQTSGNSTTLTKLIPTGTKLSNVTTVPSSNPRRCWHRAYVRKPEKTVIGSCYRDISQRHKVGTLILTCP